MTNLHQAIFINFSEDLQYSLVTRFFCPCGIFSHHRSRVKRISKNLRIQLCYTYIHGINVEY